jgi:hypothetical protein
MPDKDQDHYKTGNAHGQAPDINERVKLLLQQVPDGDFKIVSKHRVNYYSGKYILKTSYSGKGCKLIARIFRIKLIRGYFI